MAQASRELEGEFINPERHVPLHPLGQTALELIINPEVPLWEAVAVIDKKALLQHNETVITELGEGKQPFVLQINDDLEIKGSGEGSEVHTFSSRGRLYNYSLTAFNILMTSKLIGQDGVGRLQLHVQGGIPLDRVASALKNLKDEGFVRSWFENDKLPRVLYGLPENTVIIDYRTMDKEDVRKYSDWINGEDILFDRYTKSAETPPLPWGYEEDQSNPTKRICEYLLGYRDNLTANEILLYTSKIETCITVVNQLMAPWLIDKQAVFSKRAVRLRDLAALSYGKGDML